MVFSAQKKGMAVKKPKTAISEVESAKNEKLEAKYKTPSATAALKKKGTATRKPKGTAKRK